MRKVKLIKFWLTLAWIQVVALLLLLVNGSYCQIYGGVLGLSFLMYYMRLIDTLGKIGVEHVNPRPYCGPNGKESLSGMEGFLGLLLYLGKWQIGSMAIILLTAVLNYSPLWMYLFSVIELLITGMVIFNLWLFWVFNPGNPNWK